MRLLDKKFQRKKKIFSKKYFNKTKTFLKAFKKTSLKFNFCFKIIIYKSIDMLLETIGHTKLIANSGLIDVTNEFDYSQNDKFASVCR